MLVCSCDNLGDIDFVTMVKVLKRFGNQVIYVNEMLTLESVSHIFDS